MEQVIFANDYIYHIYNRGVEKRDIFLKERDYLRFILNLYEFNDVAPALNFGYQFNHAPIEVRLQYKRKKILVEILAFCLMPNHYHLLIRQKIDGGITTFMRKLGTGYTNYFNLKNARVGALFQGKFKAILIEKEKHLTHLPQYIHLNPLDIKVPEWRTGKVKDVRKALKFLKNYRWSSLLDYLGTKNFSTVTEREFLNEYVGTPKQCLDHMQEWISSANFDLIQDVSIESLE